MCAQHQYIFLIGSTDRISFSRFCRILTISVVLPLAEGEAITSLNGALNIFDNESGKSQNSEYLYHF